MKKWAVLACAGILCGCVNNSVITPDNGNISRELIVAMEQIDKYDNNYRNVVLRLEKEGKYDLASQIMLIQLNRNFSSDDFSFAIDRYQNSIQRLSQYNRLNTISRLYSDDSDVLENMTLYLPEDSQVTSVMAQYDMLKTSYLHLNELLRSELQNTDDYESLIPLVEQLAEMKNELVGNRTIYLSYNVLSPYYCKVEQLLILGHTQWYRSNDQNKLNQAVYLLAKAGHKAWLYQCNEDVRLQFLDCKKRLKDTVGKEEFEEYKLRSSLQNSLDNSKQRGGELWLQ